MPDTLRSRYSTGTVCAQRHDLPAGADGVGGRVGPAGSTGARAAVRRRFGRAGVRLAVLS